MTFPPQFDENQLYPKILDLDKVDVFLEDDTSSPAFFVVNNLPATLGYGKHYYSVGFQDPVNSPYYLRKHK